VVALEEFAERVEFAIADGEHERVVGALISGGVHGSGARRFSRRRGRMNGDFVEGGNHGGNGTWVVLPGIIERRRKGYGLFRASWIWEPIWSK
jgi:hypothetical protein